MIFQWQDWGAFLGILHTLIKLWASPYPYFLFISGHNHAVWNFLIFIWEFWCHSHFLFFPLFYVKFENLSLFPFLPICWLCMHHQSSPLAMTSAVMSVNLIYWPHKCETPSTLAMSSAVMSVKFITANFLWFPRNKAVMVIFAILVN